MVGRHHVDLLGAEQGGALIAIVGAALSTRVGWLTKLIAEGRDVIVGLHSRGCIDLDMQQDIDVVGRSSERHSVREGMCLDHQATDQSPLVGGHLSREFEHVRPRVQPAARRRRQGDSSALKSLQQLQPVAQQRQRSCALARVKGFRKV